MLEINQTCALDTGCFSGDTAGFPVTIDGTAGSSYRLTGDLSLADGNDTGILVTASMMTIDLGGFTIRGPVTCSGAGDTLSCSPAVTGFGVRFSNSLGAVGGTVRNGSVQGMGTGVSAAISGVRVDGITAAFNAVDGIGGDESMHVVQCTAIRNGSEGIDVDRASLVESSTVRENGNHGLEVDDFQGVVRGVTAIRNGGDGINTRPHSLVSESTSAENAGGGFVLGSWSKYRSSTSRDNGQPDTCGGGLCVERRRFYLTLSQHDGAIALSACDPGFHMASLWEIHDVSNFAYDWARADAFVGGDSGKGPPSGAFVGWIRTGNSASSFDSPGFGNCEAWTATSGVGTIAALEIFWNDPTLPISPWDSITSDCDGIDRSVWCVEDE